MFNIARDTSQALSRCCPQWRPDFDPLPVHLRIVNKVALGEVTIRDLRFPPVSAIPIFIFKFILLLSEGQQDEACNSSSKSNAPPEILSIKNEITSILNKKKNRDFNTEAKCMLCAKGFQ
jgi:hypothetical protein